MTNCTSIQDSMSETIDLTAVQIVFCVLYCLVWVAAIVGNTLVLYVVSFNQVSLSVRSVFIGCLAVSDMLMSLTSLPWTAITIFTREWIFPKLICKLIGVFQGGSIFVSSFTLTVIALDRCLLILKPNKELIGYHRAMAIVVAIWATGYALALPVGIFSRTVSFEGLCGVFCEEIWPDAMESGRSDGRRLYGLSVLLSQFGIPALISSICYWLISRVMSSQLERRRGHTLLKESEEKLVNRKARANRMMIAMVLGFIFAWMPLNAINLYRDWGSVINKPWFSTVFALCHVSAMTSAALNPVIYSWFNPQFRKAIQSLCSGDRKTIKNKYHNDNQVRTPQTQITEVKIKPELVVNDCHQPGDQIL
ncbi:Neuropeptide Y receptor [Trichostrongylus colubriformis]|uniref:Neuropeptide Y receptor n=1 Tax=Trichostrongylus colubriformis TaxID=6319 RepID=A0AAN8FJ17_TRICO